jgi:ankyrin repeat and MYND domain-containing protein 1
LIYNGADILQPVEVGPKRQVGTVIDYAHYMYNLDTRIAHTPYHSLNVDERSTYNARKQLLAHLAKRLWQQATEKDQLLLKNEQQNRMRNLLSPI